MTVLSVPAAGTISHDAALSIARNYFHQNHDALCNAAMALGGSKAAARLFTIIESLRREPNLTRRLRRELVAFHRLLSLEDVGDPDSDASASFSEIDIMSDLVDDICLLTDSYRTLLEDIDRCDAGAFVPADTGKERPPEAA